MDRDQGRFKNYSPVREAQALSRLRSALEKATNPIVLWSSGKDSSVVLHLTLRLRTVPVMWWRLSKFPEKQKHGQYVIRRWNLESFDALPLWVEEVQHENWWEAIHGYGPDPSWVVGMTTGVLPMEDGKPYLCAVSDLLWRPKAPSQDWPWDLMIQGHREAEPPYFGATQTFRSHTVTQAGKTLCNPIYDWSDQHVWAYLKTYKIPFDKERYYGKNTEVSPDHYRTCFACLDSRQAGQLVHCPKLHTEIPSLAKTPEQHTARLQHVQETVTHVQYRGEPQREVAVHV